MRNLTGRQCNCFRKGRERLKRDTLATEIKAMGKAFDPVLVLRRTKNVLNLWSINILSISTKQVNL